MQRMKSKSNSKHTSKARKRGSPKQQDDDLDSDELEDLVLKELQSEN